MRLEFDDEQSLLQATARDCAALFFASDESRYVSGACLPVDGAVLAAR